MNRSLLKIVEFSLLPAALLVLGKVMGVLIAGAIFEKNVSIIATDSTFWGYEINVSSSALVLINSFSDFVMYSFVAIYFAFVVYRALFLHNTHVSDSTVQKLSKKNLLHWISSSYDLYHLAVAAGIFLWISNTIIWINTITGNTSLFVSVFTTIISLMMTSLVLQDMYHEIENSKTQVASK